MKIINPNAINRTAKNNCSPSVINANPPVTNNFKQMLYTDIPKLVIVTTNIITIGTYNIYPLRPVTFKNTDNETNTIAASNWLALPNNGQIFKYPPKLNR